MDLVEKKWGTCPAILIYHNIVGEKQHPTMFEVSCFTLSSYSGDNAERPWLGHIFKNEPVYKPSFLEIVDEYLDRKISKIKLRTISNFQYVAF